MLWDTSPVRNCKWTMLSRHPDKAYPTVFVAHFQTSPCWVLIVHGRYAYSIRVRGERTIRLHNVVEPVSVNRRSQRLMSLYTRDSNQRPARFIRRPAHRDDVYCHLCPALGPAQARSAWETPARRDGKGFRFLCPIRAPSVARAGPRRGERHIVDQRWPGVDAADVAQPGAARSVAERFEI